ncbi:zinc finger CCCH domain-containing protein 2-like [Lotus japonicus]|uniref:zinc finger CCCH domain-containing protein 2-like n=1 Tax=Lotus japonicus TaxID=34305 RepID=UPI00258F83F1|nr:zinc finger CCCH domain-containing protein 2-like [Lotus japonicus]
MSSGVCSEQLLSLKKSLRDIDIPPRKLLPRRTGDFSPAGDMFSDETLLQKYLPHNGPPDSDDDDPYSSDHFRMFEFKVRRCTRSRSHDWTECPFAHPGEKARRRDPRRFHYSGAVCPEYRRAGACSRGDACEFSHGVFECWLHPARYRTEACKDGRNCKRKVCFFAHSPRQLRVLPSDLNNNDMGFHQKSSTKLLNKCCSFCHCSSVSCSPTSTLFGVSHFSSSPPMSPSSSPSPSPSRSLSRFVDFNHQMSCKELLCSLEGLNFGDSVSSSPVSASKLNWLDVSPGNSSGRFSSGKKYSMGEENKVGGGGGGVNCDEVTSAPDFGWVNDLLM